MSGGRDKEVAGTQHIEAMQGMPKERIAMNVSIVFFSIIFVSQQRSNNKLKPMP